jgi:hypothetical protein
MDWFDVVFPQFALLRDFFSGSNDSTTQTKKEQQISNSNTSNSSAVPSTYVPINVNIPTEVYSPNFSPQLSYVYQPIITLNSPGANASTTATSKKEMSTYQSPTASNTPYIPLNYSYSPSNSTLDGLYPKWLLAAAAIAIGIAIIK